MCIRDRRHFRDFGGPTAFRPSLVAWSCLCHARECPVVLAGVVRRVSSRNSRWPARLLSKSYRIHARRLASPVVRCGTRIPQPFYTLIQIVAVPEARFLVLSILRSTVPVMRRKPRFIGIRLSLIHTSD